MRIVGDDSFRRFWIELVADLEGDVEVVLDVAQEVEKTLRRAQLVTPGSAHRALKKTNILKVKLE